MAKKARRKNGIIIDGVSMDKTFIQSFKTEAEFIKAMDDKTYAHIFPGENRKAKLKEVYNAVPWPEPEKTK